LRKLLENDAKLPGSDTIVEINPHEDGRLIAATSAEKALHIWRVR